MLYNSVVFRFYYEEVLITSLYVIPFKGGTSMSISDAITSIGTLVTIAAVVVGALLYIITKKPGKPGTKVLIIISAITTAIIVGIVGTAVFISASTTI